jgi:hypothetical protein
MAYIRKDYYEGFYGELPEKDFDRLSWDACRMLDLYTTGIDGVKKLKAYFPTDDDDATAVKRCACKLVNTIHQIEVAEAASNSAQGYESTDQGLRGKVITSVSAGNESITYSAKGFETVIQKAVGDEYFKKALMRDMIREYLSGVNDANGVNLLYMGRYPRV